MRGGAFHNWMVCEVCEALAASGWEIETEYRYEKNGVVTFFDVYAVRDGREVAVEVETTARHVLDNVRKARAVGVEVLVVVPNRRLKCVVRKMLNKNSLYMNNT